MHQAEEAVKDIQSFFGDERGSAIEYGAVVIGVSTFVSTTFTILGSQVLTNWSSAVGLADVTAKCMQ